MRLILSRQPRSDGRQRFGDYDFVAVTYEFKDALLPTEAPRSICCYPPCGSSPARAGRTLAAGRGPCAERYRRRGKKEIAQRWPGAGHRVARQTADFGLRPKRRDWAEPGFDGDARLPYACWRVLGRSEAQISPIQHLLECADALYAAHHLVGGDVARGSRSRLSGLARLHPPAAPICR